MAVDVGNPAGLVGHVGGTGVSSVKSGDWGESRDAGDSMRVSSWDIISSMLRSSEASCKRSLGVGMLTPSPPPIGEVGGSVLTRVFMANERLGAESLFNYATF